MSERPPLLAVRLPLLAVLGSAAVAVLVFARTLDGGFLSDDLLLGVLGEVTADGGFRVDWGAVLADFGRPWLGFDVPFYRPMLTISFAVDQTLGGGAAWPFHLTNVLLHAGVTAAAAALAARLCPRRPATAAWIAGLCVAVHPVAVEPVAWIAARNSELEVFFRTLAMLLFAWHLHGRSRRTLAGALALGACALATKESAVMLPVSLLAIDLLDRPARPWRERLRVHLPFALLLAGYFALRLVVLGSPLGDGGGAATGTALSRFGAKLGALLAAGFATGPLMGFVVAAGLFGARTTLAVGAGWLALHAVPTWQIAMAADFGGSRMVYGALPALGVVIALLVDGASAWLRVAPLLAVGTWAMLVLPTLDRLDAYDDAWRDMAAARAGIADLADRATPDRPLAIAAMPPNAPGIPPCNPNAWFPLAERPHQPLDVPVVSLGYVTVPVPMAEPLFGDAGPIRALGAHGCAIAAWHPGGEFLVRQRTGPVELPALERVAGTPGAFRFGLPLPPADGIEALTIVVVGGHPDGARITWQTPGPELPSDLGGLEVGGGTPDGDGARIEVDLTHHLGLPSLATLGVPLTGLTVALRGAGHVERLEVHARIPELAVPGAPLAGGTFDLASFAARRAPSVAAGATLRLVLQGPHSAIPVPCEPGEPVRVPAGVRREFEIFARIARQDRFLYWFEARTPPGTAGYARSAVDWFVLAPAGR